MTARPAVLLTEAEIAVALYAITGDLTFSSVETGIDPVKLRAAATAAGMRVGRGSAPKTSGTCKRGHDRAIYRKTNNRGGGFCSQCQRDRARVWAAKNAKRGDTAS